MSHVSTPPSIFACHGLSQFNPLLIESSRDSSTLWVFVCFTITPPPAVDALSCLVHGVHRFGFTPLMLAASMQRAPGDGGGIGTGPDTAYSLCEVR